MSTLSVVVITYKRDAFLSECLASLDSQTHPVHEVVVVDDGGPGTARAIVEELGPRFRYVWQPNGGQPSARNLGSRIATGEWIAYLDDDDLWLPERHARLAEVIAGKEADLIVSDFVKFGDGWQSNDSIFDEIAEQSSGFWDDLPYQSDASYSLIGKFPITRLIPVHPFWPSAMAIHRKLLDKLDGWNESLRGVKSEDFEFAYRAVREGNLAVLWQPTVHYRCHTGNDSSSTMLNAIGRAKIWKTLLKEQELSANEIQTLTNAVEASHHEILWSAFSNKDYSTVIHVAQDLSKNSMSRNEKLKIAISKMAVMAKRIFA